MGCVASSPSDRNMAAPAKVGMMINGTSHVSHSSVHNIKPLRGAISNDSFIEDLHQRSFRPGMLMESRSVAHASQDSVMEQSPSAGSRHAMIAGRAGYAAQPLSTSTFRQPSSRMAPQDIRSSEGHDCPSVSSDMASGYKIKRSGERTSGAAPTPGSAATRASSARSSFAVDASFGSNVVGSARSKAERLQDNKLYDSPSSPTAGVKPSIGAAPPAPIQVPMHLESYFSKLVVLPPETPVPSSMLQKLWNKPNPADAMAIIKQLQQFNVLRVAVLDDGSLWCLVADTTLQQLQGKYGEQASNFHAGLLDAYTTGPKGQALQIRDVADDGYIMQNIAHHLLGCGRTGGLRALLGEPAWLEAKLLSYGTAPVVSDFRRYLNEVSDDSGARLLLQALQLSLGCCAENPGVRMLREQMLARLMAVTQAHEGGLPVHGSMITGPPPNFRIPITALVQGDGSTTNDGTNTATGLSSQQGLTGSISLTPKRDSARYSHGTNSSLREWFEYQSSRAAMDICAAAGCSTVHLLPRSASLKQAGGVQRMILRGHTGAVKKVVISPNGQDVVTVSEDGTAQVWDMNVGDCVMQLARKQPLMDVCVAPDGCLCVVASMDGAACVWDLATGTVKHVLKGHTSKINSVAIDRAGMLCLTASDDRSVRVWSIEKGKPIGTLAGHGKSVGSGEFGLVFDVALSADGCMAATASEDFTARVWDMATLKCEHVLEGHSGWVVSVAFIGESTHLITASHDCTARVWDGVRGVCLHILSGHTARLSRVRVSSNAKVALTCSDDGSARVWDVQSGRCKSILQRHDAWVSDAALSRDGDRAVTVGGDGLVCVWNTNKGDMQAALEGHTQALSSVVMTSGGRFAVTAGDDHTARVWDLSMEASKAVQPQKGHRSKVRALRALQGGRQVVSCCDDGTLMIWDVATCQPVRTLQEHDSAVAFLDVSLDGTRVLSGTASRHVCCWGMPSCQLVSTLPKQQGSRVKEMTFSAAGTAVGVVLYDSTTAVWDMDKGTLIAQLIGRGERAGRNVHTGGVNGILLCGGRNGAACAVTWSKDCTARVWDVATSSVRLVLEGHTDGIRCAALTQDQSVLATASYGACVRLHMMDDGAPLAVLDHAAPATHLAFSPDGRWLAVALENHTVVMWDLVAHNCLPPLQAHKADITCIIYSPDSAILATCSQDSTARVWDARTGRQIAFFVADTALTACCFAGGSSCAADILVVGDAGGGTHFLDLPPELQPDSAMY